MSNFSLEVLNPLVLVCGCLLCCNICLVRAYRSRDMSRDLFRENIKDLTDGRRL